MSHPRRLAAAWIVSACLAASGCGPAAPEPSFDAIRDAEIARRPEAPALAAAVDDVDPAVRARAALALGRVQAASSAATLGRLASDPDPDVAGAALFALGQLGLATGARADATAVEGCTARLGDDDPTVVALAVECLGKQAPDDAAGRLGTAFEHGASAVREQAAHAAMRLRFAPVWRGEREDPTDWDDRTVERLASLLLDPEPAVRIAAAHAFSRYGEPRAIDALAGAARDGDAIVRRFAVRALGRSDAAARERVLVDACSDPDAFVRYEAVAALDALGLAGAVPPETGSDPSAHVRARVAATLGASASPGLLSALLDDPSPTVVAAAVEAFPVDGSRGFPGALSGARGDERWAVRAAAARTAGRAGESASDVLAALGRDPDPRVRAAAIEATSGLGDSPTTRTLVEAGLEASTLAERGAAVARLAASTWDDRIDRLVAAYREALDVDGVEIRETIVSAVRDDPAAALLLELAKSDPAPSVRALAGATDVSGTPSGPAPPFGPWTGEPEPVVTLETTRGTIEIRLFPDAAPYHVANFVGLVRDGFYDGLPWHRVVPDFVIQGGDPEGSGWGGPGWTVPDEISRRGFVRGTVGMPKAGKDTGGCQLFVTHLPTPHLDGNYTVFGQVVSGLDVVDAVEVGDRIVAARVAGAN